MITVVRYETGMKKIWNEFIAKAKNKHFMFYREYMEYHRERFLDHSLLLYDERQRLCAVFPATQNGDALVSHEGLTFGGFIVGDKMNVVDMLEMFSKIREYSVKKNIRSITYKCIPYIYHRYPCEEDLYALYMNKAKLIRRDIASTIYIPSRYSYRKSRKWSVQQGKKNKVSVHSDGNFEAYMKLVNMVLEKYHNTHAVHSGTEMQMLAERFPENIKLWVGDSNGEILAGTIVFDTGKTIHTQYLANSDNGRKLGALDCVIDYLLTEAYKDRIYFDFGTSNIGTHSELNVGLIRQKEGFGARAVVYDQYFLTI